MNKRYFLVVFCLCAIFASFGLASAANNELPKGNFFQSIINFFFNKGKADLTEAVSKDIPCGSYGDIDADGKITVSDVNLGREYVNNGSAKLSTVDVDGNGIADSNDITMISDYLGGKIDTFTVCRVGAVKYICTDSDQGKTYNTRGVVKWGPANGKYEEIPDVCTTDKKLSEQYCANTQNCSNGICSDIAGINADSTPASESYECPNGCKDGACIAAPAKDYSKFSVTELIEDKLPDSITFWTTALCPNASRFNYVVPDGYTAVSCEAGTVGSHGGCSFCAMSKIKLVKGSSVTPPTVECIGEGLGISVTPAGFKQSCCSGLVLCPPSSTVVGSRGTCKKTCDSVIEEQTFSILNPKAGESLNQGVRYTMNYKTTGYSSDTAFDVYLSGPNDLYRKLGSLSAGKTSFAFTVPSDLTGAGYQLTVPGEAITDTFSIGSTEKKSCSQVHSPVCGADSKTYSNECLAKAAGTTVSAKGECKKTTTTTNIPNPDKPLNQMTRDELINYLIMLIQVLLKDKNTTTTTTTITPSEDVSIDTGDAQSYCMNVSMGEVVDDNGSKYCIVSKKVFEEGCGGTHGEGSSYCPKSGSGTVKLNIPSSFSEVKLTSVKFDDSGSILVNNNNVYTSGSGCGRSATNLDEDITSYVHAGANDLTALVDNDCGLSMSASVGIKFKLGN